MLDDSKFSVISDFDPALVVLLVDDNVQLPVELLKNYTVKAVKEIPYVEESSLCREFTKKYESLDTTNRYENVLEGHINGVYEYFISPLNNIIFTLERLLEVDDSVVLYGGNKFFKVAPYYAIKSAEFNKNIFFRRSDVFSPFLYEALTSRYQVKYIDDAYFFTLSRYFLRVTCLFLFSYIKTVVKYLSRIKFKRQANIFFDVTRSKTIVFPVRCNAHMDYVEPIATSILKYSDKLPIILSYEMLMGSDFSVRLEKSKLPCISLFNFLWLPLLLFSPFLMLKNLFFQYRQFNAMGSKRFGVRGLSYSIEFSHIAYENFLVPHVFIYSALLKKAIHKLSASDEFNVCSVCSSEMIGLQSFVERKVSKDNGFSFYNLQVAALSKHTHPVKVVGDKLFCLDAGSELSLNATGIRNKGKAVFVGQLKYLKPEFKPAESKELVSILYATQPYETEITVSFLKVLIDWVETQKKEVKIRIRVHPRDNANFYKTLANVELISNTETVVESVEKSSLVLSRTSSVLFDSLNLNVPFLACIFSNLDEKINLEVLPDQCYQATSFDMVLEMIEDFSGFSSGFRQCVLDFMKARDGFCSDEEKIMKFLSNVEC